MGKQVTPDYTSTIFLLASAIILALVSFKIFDVIYQVQNAALIDEIFHIPQAQLYCDNRWTEWNPKITTLPGLYIISYIILKPLEIIGFQDICSAYTLRLTNVIATVFNFCITYLICSSLEKKFKEKPKTINKLLTSFNIAIFPPLYFFTFLYYTDVWSMTFVLLLYHSHLTKQRLLATFASIMAVLMRQTNIIWVGLCIIDDAWNTLSMNTTSVQSYNDTIKVCKTLMSEYFTSKKKNKSIIGLILTMLSRTYHYIVVCLLFVTFVVVNGSIVLGDKSAHAATFHPMQNLYAFDFIAFFALPFYLFEVPNVLKKPPSLFLTVFLIGLCAGLSETNKLEHPYLLADNRHLAFYLWKRFFGHRIVRRMLVPTYVCSAVILYRLLSKRCHFMFIVALSLCTFLNLTPQYLFELRYFITPFVMYRLQFKQSRAVYLETAFFILINAAVVYLFINRPFVWASEPGVKQRFIW